MFEHGGRVLQAASHYGIAADQWLDLSTGINPVAWPCPDIPATAWQHLPEEEDGLLAQARQYYDCPHCLAVAGSQAAIQILPRCQPSARIGMLEPAYYEHASAWRRAGHSVVCVDHSNPGKDIGHIDHLLLINPNNPTGQCFASEELLQWHARLSIKQGWLIVDEAFMDATPENSLCTYTQRPGLVVLRSLGKFFGLAGARVGFVMAHPSILDKVAELAGPWTVTGPSRFIAERALRDQRWQSNTRSRLIADSQRLGNLLRQHHLIPSADSVLFQWVKLTQAEKLKDYFAQQGILVRYFKHPASLRFGLPTNDNDWQRLQQTLNNIPGKLLR